MAKSFTKKPKVQQMPTPEGSSAPPEQSGMEANAPQPDPATPFDDPQVENPGEPQKNRGGRPRKGMESATPKSLTFFERVQTIPFADWGTRAKIKCYRLAPLINKLVGSECKYICVYAEGLTEDKLKVDHGSGRYRLYLSYKAAGKENEDTLDVVEVDILDPKFPPNIPPGEWMDDHRNKPWAWAKPIGAPGPSYPQYNQPQPQQPAAAPVDAVLQGMRVATEMRKELREEMRPAVEQQQPAPVAAQPAPTVDPWAAAERILNMRSENPMVTILQGQLSALQASIDKDREERAKLQQQIFDAKLEALEAKFKQPAAQASKGLLEQAKELADAFGITPADMLKRFMGGDGAVAAPVKSRMNGTMEFFSDLIPKIVDSPIMNAIAQRLTQPQQQAAPNPSVNITPQPNGQQPQQQTPQQEMFAFVNQHVTPALIEFLKVDNSGAEFAQWMYNGFPLERLEALQNVTHELMPGMKGEPVIVELYKHASGGKIWREFLGAREQQFNTFVHEFCQWHPPEDEEEEKPQAAAPSTDESSQAASQGDF